MSLSPFDSSQSRFVTYLLNRPRSFSSICAYILEVECSFRNPYQILSAILIVPMFARLPTDVIVRSLILFIRNTQTD